MAFHSGAFLFLFLPVFLGIFHLVPRKARPWWLLAASVLFYAWWRLDHLALLAGIAAAAWGLGRLVGSLRDAHPRRARGLLTLGVALALAVLAFFKYAGFALEGINVLLGGVGAASLPVVRIALPLGISFSAFKAISYLVDVSRGTCPPGSPAEVALYIFSFPQVVSGPIDRFAAFAPQLHADGRSWESFARGAMRFMRGFCAKVLIADAIAPLANAVFALERPALVDSWLGSGAYTMQLFFDFAGYSDMAIGLGLMMGLSFMENFRAPYLSASVTEFWKRWHISLSSWLRDYLYIPLGGSRHGLARTCLNLGLVMVLGGLWHGAALTFVLWGAWHGLLLVLERLGGERRSRARIAFGTLPRTLPRPLGVLLTMLAVNAGWVLFRAPNPAAALRMYAGMIGLHGAGLGPALAPQVEMLSVAALAAAFLLVYAGPWVARRLEGRTADALRLLILPFFALALVRVLAGSPAVFLYGKF